MDRNPSGILSILPEFLDSDGIPGFQRIPAGISGGVKSIAFSA